MANYETVIIIRQDVSTNQVETIMDEIVKGLTDAEGKISRREYWGLRSLAYRIRKNRKGHYNLNMLTESFCSQKRLDLLEKKQALTNKGVDAAKLRFIR